MANFLTSACFVIPCQQDQASTAISALTMFGDERSDIASIVAKNNDDSFTEAELVIRHCYFNHPYLEDYAQVGDLDWDFKAVLCAEGIMVTSDESINTEHAALFTQAVLLAYDLPELVIIEAAHTCDKDRLDAFGGHACIVTSHAIRWATSNEFINAEVAAHKDKKHYFACNITVVNGEYEYKQTFLMVCDDSQCPDNRLDDIFLNFRGKGERKIMILCGLTMAWLLRTPATPK